MTVKKCSNCSRDLSLKFGQNCVRNSLNISDFEFAVEEPLLIRWITWLILPGFANLKTQSLISWVPEPLPKTNNIYKFRERWGLGGFPDSIGIKWNQKSRKIQQNNQFWPKYYPIFWFRPKFRLNNWFWHSQGRNQISNFGFRLNRNRNHTFEFGFGWAENQNLIFRFVLGYAEIGCLAEILAETEI